MRFEIDEFMSELNSISRVAVIENATLTERMLFCYSTLMKYKWKNEGKSVIADNEMKNLLKLCELYDIKYNNKYAYSLKSKIDLKSIFIPHYSIIGVVEHMEQQAAKEGVSLELKISIYDLDNKTHIKIKLISPKRYNMKEILREDNSEEYCDIRQCIYRWKNTFGDKTVQMKENEILFHLT
ncbi:MAG: hypothetical protein ACERKZ_12960 [Lachnotalea sp.]